MYRPRSPPSGYGPPPSQGGPLPGRQRDPDMYRRPSAPSQYGGEGRSHYGGGGSQYGGGGGSQYGGPPYDDRDRLPGVSYGGRLPLSPGPDRKLQDDIYYSDRRTEADVANDFRRMSVGGPVSRGRESAPSVTYGGRARSIPREPSPEDDRLSRYAPEPEADRSPPGRGPPSASLDRQSRYVPRGYHYAGPKPTRVPGRGSEYGDESSRGVVMPARTQRMGLLRRSSSVGAKSARRKNSDETIRESIKERETVRERESIRDRDSIHESIRGSVRGSVRGPSTTSNSAIAAAKLGRSRSVGRALISQRPPVVTEGENGQTAVKLDLGGREVEIGVTDSKSGRRGPVIGNITINQIGKKPKPETTTAIVSTRDGARMSSVSSSSSSEGYIRRDEDPGPRFRRGSDFHRDIVDVRRGDDFRRETDIEARVTRARSASLGNALSERRPQLAVEGPPMGAPPIPPPPPGGFRAERAERTERSELRHTRISKKIVTRDALEDLGYEFDDTDDTFTVLRILRPEEIDTLMDLSARFRAARHDDRRARSRDERSVYQEIRRERADSQDSDEDDFPLDNRSLPPIKGVRHGPPPAPPTTMPRERGRFPVDEDDTDMPGAWPSVGPLGNGGGGGLRENPNIPGTYLGYTRGPQVPVAQGPVGTRYIPREGQRYNR